MSDPTTTSYVLTIVDTSRIQDYIFGSNRLREHIGASQQVHAATTTYVTEALRTIQDNPPDLADLSTQSALESDPNQPYEVIYTGAGNVLLLFRHLKDAQALVRELSLLLHTHAPGLQIAAAHRPFAWGSETLGDQDDAPGVVAQLYSDLARAKQHRPPTAQLFGLGVTLDCPSTGLPATRREPDTGNERRFVSASTMGKVQARATGTTRLQTLLDDSVLAEYAIPADLDDLGRSRDEQSYIAVVHIDGNGMGQRFASQGYNRDNRDYITAIRDLSQQVNAAANTALQKTIDALVACLHLHAGVDDKHPMQQRWWRERDQFLHSLALDPTEKKPFLPLRPIVFGGDDVTFVCDGRLGLTLAQRFLTEFEQATTNLAGGGVAHACAGVAIVKSHFPFARAYALAADLCTKAKQTLRSKEDDLTAYSALDWHIVASGRNETIKAIRDREYRDTTGTTLTARPLLLGTAEDLLSDWHPRTWAQLQQTVSQLKYTDDWFERRNKVLALREVLRQGQQAVEQFKTRYTIETLPHPTHALLFDAIETMEFLLPLEPPEDEGEVPL